MITFNQNDILESLAAGVSADDIAKNFTKALNAAIAEQKARDTKAAEKKTRLDAILDLADEFIKDYYPEIYDEPYTTSTEDIITVMDEVYEKSLKMFSATKPKKPTSPIAEFLMKHNL